MLALKAPTPIRKPHTHVCTDAITQPPSAEATLREALRIRQAILEEDDPALATTRSNLASVLQRTGRAAEVGLCVCMRVCVAS